MLSKKKKKKKKKNCVSKKNKKKQKLIVRRKIPNPSDVAKRFCSVNLGNLLVFFFFFFVLVCFCFFPQQRRRKKKSLSPCKYITPPQITMATTHLRVSKDWVKTQAQVNNNPNIISASIPNEDDPTLWEVSFKGPSSTPYEKGAFVLEIKLPENYPFSSPQVNLFSFFFFSNSSLHFSFLNPHPSPFFSLFPLQIRLKTKILHPNITGDGRFCHKEEKGFRDSWVPRNQPYIAVDVVRSVLEDPQVDNPVQLEGADKEVFCLKEAASFFFFFFFFFFLFSFFSSFSFQLSPLCPEHLCPISFIVQKR